ncbi:cofactor D [Cryptococcus gattii Ru294]|uniref:Cofactor D n=1 Tax=Cryptococcus gattii EJB2 TaxID=1296103 RepID=A0ABR5BTX4_9TREE|nr:cofactor D [Cryptococcus gattii Ru294]KIR79069.1 cofactor D [Cryptococcus gattii EJB2]KIY35427.1 cofactor D [Cryptococcus gattii E566]KJD99725.1 cofactor D [Cryptococcus gattii NT-10]
MSSAPLVDDWDPTYTHFSHRTEFLDLLQKFLTLDICKESTEKEDEDEDAIVACLGAILDYYLPMPGLLDPSLDEIVRPLMQLLEKSLHTIVEEDRHTSNPVNPKRLERLGRVLNWVVKVRGWKAVVPHFPSTIPNLPILIKLFSPITSFSASTSPVTPHHHVLSSTTTWELRAVLLLWLALLLTVPFNLSALSNSDDFVSSIPYGIDLPSSELLFPTATSELAQKVTFLTVPLLHRPGREGAYAALVLARLLSREDAVQGLRGFFAWATSEIEDGDRESESHLIASLFTLLALLPSLLKSSHLPMVEGFLGEKLLPHLRGSRTAAESGLIRKLAIKAKGRLWVSKLGKKYSNDDDVDLPEGLEEILDDLMGGLSDKDTIVRYSSAKYLSRISASLPPAFSSQIVLATISLFAGTEEEPVQFTSFGTVIDPGGSSASGGTMGFGGSEVQRGEARWHGVCLALAEMGRRGLIWGEAVEGAVKWVVKALTFDLRRASHSIGANVRDAASYLLWSLSRACPPSALEPYVSTVATSLVCVACFDREVGVRRAASAAFQEGVGRTGVYPEGIDVLAKTDFHSVSVRRTAFLTASQAVGVHHVYRTAMIAHLHNITLRHWDCSIRCLGAQALRKLLEQNSKEMLEDALQRELKELVSLDSVNVHGALVALKEVAEMFEDDDPRNQTVFDALATIRASALVSQQAADILTALCDLLSTILNVSITSYATTQPVLARYFELASKRREVEVHESMARVYRRLSELRNCEKDVAKLINDLRSFRVTQRQSSTLALGHIQYPTAPSSMAEKTVVALLGLLKDPTKTEVESRRWAVRSLGDIAVQRRDGSLVVESTTLNMIVRAFIKGLEDYSTDQRGDVGSWVRIASLDSIGRVLASLSPPSPLSSILEPGIYDEVIGGLVKQGVEKLESVRSASALALARMRECGWQWDTQGAMSVSRKQLDEEGFRYVDQEEWFQSAMPLLETRFMEELVTGLTFTIGSQVVTLSNAALRPFIEYLTVHTSTIVPVLQTLSNLMANNFNSNRIFIPTLQTLHKLLSANIWEKIDAKDHNAGADALMKSLSAATRGLGNIKSIERITAAMRVVIACLAAPSEVCSKATSLISLFLAHRFPRIRAMASEEIYLALSEVNDDMDEELEQVLLEVDWVGSGVEQQAERVARLLQGRKEKS